MLLTINDSCCDSADGVQLYELRTPDGAPRFLGTVLKDSLAPSYGPDGTFAVGSGGNRYAWTNKSVALCNGATATCMALATQTGVLAVAPAWSPDHQTLAFVEAASQSQGMIGQQQVTEWYSTHHLYLLSSGAKVPIECPAHKAPLPRPGQRTRRA